MIQDDGLREFSEIFARAAKAMEREAFARDIEWARFLADGEQWCRVTNQGIEIIPRAEIYKQVDTTPCGPDEIKAQEKDG